MKFNNNAVVPEAYEAGSVGGKNTIRFTESVSF